MSEQGPRLVRNTTRDYPCVNCGSNLTSIIREGPDPRLKCSACQLMFDGSVSLEAKEKGEIPDGPPQLQEQTYERKPSLVDGSRADDEGPKEKALPVPKRPTHVFISKDREKQEFCTKRDLKQVAFRWEYEGIKYDLYELQTKLVSTSINIA